VTATNVVGREAPPTRKQGRETNRERFDPRLDSKEEMMNARISTMGRKAAWFATTAVAVTLVTSVASADHFIVARNTSGTLPALYRTSSSQVG
jgi:hypothetical protein